MVENKIIINATCDRKKPSGLGLYTREIVSRLIKLNPDIFKVYCIYDFLPQYKEKKILTARFSSDYGTTGNFLRWFWEQSLLGINCMPKKSLLFSTVPEAPFFIKNKCIVVHDILPIRFPDAFPRMKYYYYYILPYILKSSRYIIYVSENTREEVIKYYNLPNIPSSVIYPGYNRELFTTIEKGFIKKKYGIEDYYLFIGEMRPYKNLKNAILAFSKLEKKDVYFLIGGKKDNKFFPELKKLTEEMNLTERVRFLDYVPNEILPHLYRNALALVFPSRYEGFGSPPLEAMAMGIPAITTRVSAIPEVCGDAALYVSPDDITEMSKAFNLMLTDNNLRNSLSNLALQRSKMFSWENAAKKIYEILINLNNK